MSETESGNNARANDAGANAAPAKPRGRKRKRALLILTIVVIVGVVAYTLLHFLVFRWRESTDDAYVGGNQVNVTAQIAGTVVAIMADETRRVQAGQALIRLDPTNTNIALEEARSALALAVRQVRQQFAQSGQYSSLVEQRSAEVERARADYARRKPLLAEHAVPAEEVRHARDVLVAAEAALRAAKEQARAAQAAVSDTDIAHNPAVLAARARFHDAWVNAQRTTIPAPVSGQVARRSVQLGERVAPGGNPLMSIVPLDELWIDANFKEGQLANIRIGQPATIDTDVYGGDVGFKGRVVGLGAGTGSAFALLPAQNASGNWIKVVQRVPVRIAIDSAQLAAHPLRIGLSADVTVDTHDRSGPVLAPAASTQPVYSTDVYDRSDAEANAEADRIIAENAGEAAQQPK